jgi:hypothetical protein
MVPTEAAAVCRVASNTICNWERNWALVPEWSVLRQHFLPETPTGSEQWVIGHEECIVVVAGGESGVLKMAGHFSLIVLQALGDD